MLQVDKVTSSFIAQASAHDQTTCTIAHQIKIKSNQTNTITITKFLFLHHLCLSSRASSLLRNLQVEFNSREMLSWIELLGRREKVLLETRRLLARHLLVYVSAIIIKQKLLKLCVFVAAWILILSNQKGHSSEIRSGRWRLDGLISCGCQSMREKLVDAQIVSGSRRNQAHLLMRRPLQIWPPQLTFHWNLKPILDFQTRLLYESKLNKTILFVSLVENLLQDYLIGFLCF